MLLLSREVPAAIPEGDQPLLELVARRFDGSVLDLTDATVTWVSKPSPDMADASGVTISATVVDAPAGRFDVQLTAPVTATPGTIFYKCKLEREGQTGPRPFTFQHGPLVVVNT